MSHLICRFQGLIETFFFLPYSSSCPVWLSRTPVATCHDAGVTNPQQATGRTESPLARVVRNTVAPWAAMLKSPDTINPQALKQTWKVTSELSRESKASGQTGGRQVLESLSCQARRACRVSTIAQRSGSGTLFIHKAGLSNELGKKLLCRLQVVCRWKMWRAGQGKKKNSVVMNACLVGHVVFCETAHLTALLGPVSDLETTGEEM